MNGYWYYKPTGHYLKINECDLHEYFGDHWNDGMEAALFMKENGYPVVVWTAGAWHPKTGSKFKGPAIGEELIFKHNITGQKITLQYLAVITIENQDALMREYKNTIPHWTLK